MYVIGGKSDDKKALKSCMKNQFLHFLLILQLIFITNKTLKFLRLTIKFTNKKVSG